MQRKTSLLIIYLAASGIMSGLVSGAAFAEDKPVTEGPSLTEKGEPIIPEEIISDPIHNEIEIGIGYVSDDAYKFGRYNGMYEKGPFVVGDINIRDFYDDGRFWRVRGTNLGLESRYLRMDGGVQGSYKFFLEYDELPNYKNNTVQSPFIGIGGNILTLPSGFDINTNLDANLNSFELETKRKRAKVGAMFIPKENWQFDIDVSHENKQGVDATGSAIANGTTQMVGNTTIAILPEPIDQDTDIVNATLSYAGDGSQVDLKYQMSLFDNNNNSLSWQDPFNPVAAGSMSLAPDNEFHQLSITGGYTLPYKSRLTGLISYGRMTQNQNFQPYTINNNATTSALPVTSLDGEVWLTNAQLKLTSRPVNRLRLNAELRYNERDNKTPVNTYDYVILDSDNFTNTATNRPLSYKNNRIKLDANYRFNAITSLRGGYKYDEMKRSYTNAEREDTEENTLFAKWKIKAHSTVDVALFAEASKRDGSDYNSLATENPAMRKYHLADRDRTKIGTTIDYMATEKLFLSARVDYNKDDYTDSVIGLTEAIQPVYTVDFSYQPRHNITTYGYYTYENIESSQAGSALGTATADWEADFEDTFDTIGLGTKWTDLGRWEIGADIVYSKSNGASQMKDLFAPGTEGQYPDTKTELTSIKLWTNYNHSKQLSYKLGFWFEDYTADNWAVDGLQPYDPLVVENTLLLGNEALDYDVYVITLSASYKY
jgi:MtrB/PioB family decaheme-associated outer membrane protein